MFIKTQEVSLDNEINSFFDLENSILISLLLVDDHENEDIIGPREPGTTKEITSPAEDVTLSGADVFGNTIKPPPIRLHKSCEGGGSAECNAGPCLVSRFRIQNVSHPLLEPISDITSIPLMGNIKFDDSSISTKRISWIQPPSTANVYYHPATKAIVNKSFKRPVSRPEGNINDVIPRLLDSSLAPLRISPCIRYFMYMYQNSVIICDTPFFLYSTLNAPDESDTDNVSTALSAHGADDGAGNNNTSDPKPFVFYAKILARIVSEFCLQRFISCDWISNETESSHACGFKTEEGSLLSSASSSGANKLSNTRMGHARHHYMERSFILVIRAHSISLWASDTVRLHAVEECERNGEPIGHISSELSSQCSISHLEPGSPTPFCFDVLRGKSSYIDSGPIIPDKEPSNRNESPSSRLSINVTPIQVLSVRTFVVHKWVNSWTGFVLLLTDDDMLTPIVVKKRRGDREIVHVSRKFSIRSTVNNIDMATTIGIQDPVVEDTVRVPEKMLNFLKSIKILSITANLPNNISRIEHLVFYLDKTDGVLSIRSVSEDVSEKPDKIFFVPSVDWIIDDGDELGRMGIEKRASSGLSTPLPEYNVTQIAGPILALLVNMRVYFIHLDVPHVPFFTHIISPGGFPFEIQRGISSVLYDDSPELFTRGTTRTLLVSPSRFSRAGVLQCRQCFPSVSTIHGNSSKMNVYIALLSLDIEVFCRALSEEKPIDEVAAILRHSSQGRIHVCSSLVDKILTIASGGGFYEEDNFQRICQAIRTLLPLMSPGSLVDQILEPIIYFMKKYKEAGNGTTSSTNKPDDRDSDCLSSEVSSPGSASSGGTSLENLCAFNSTHPTAKTERMNLTGNCVYRKAMVNDIPIPEEDPFTEPHKARFEPRYYSELSLYDRVNSMDTVNFLYYLVVEILVYLYDNISDQSFVRIERILEQITIWQNDPIAISLLKLNFPWLMD